MGKEIKESDLFQPICEYLTELGYNVKGEVKGCDITAVKDEQLIIVELKKGITISLLTQGVDRQRLGDLVYLAVPKPKSFRMNKSFKKTLHLLRRLELGLIFVNFKTKGTGVEVILEAESFDRTKSKSFAIERKGKLLVEHLTRKSSSNIGGTNKTKLLTSYREKVIEIAYLLKKHGPLKISDINTKTKGDKKTGAFLRSNHYGWFYKESRGIYGLTAVGEEGLIEYSSYINEFLEE